MAATRALSVFLERQHSPTSPELGSPRLRWTPIGALRGLGRDDGRYIRLERLRGPEPKFSRRTWTPRSSSRWQKTALARLSSRPEYIYLNLRLHRLSPLISSLLRSSCFSTICPPRRRQTPRPRSPPSSCPTSPRVPARPSPPPLQTPAPRSRKRNPERRSQKAPSEPSRAATPAEFAERYAPLAPPHPSVTHH